MENFDLYRLDGHTLRVFVSIYETGSVSRTAEQFGLNQSTISHTLDKMRAAVGDPLFIKSGRGITPTQKAFTILPRVQGILTELEGLIAAEKYDALSDTSSIVVGIPSPALLEDMKLLASRLAKAAPNAIFELRRLAPRDRVTEMLTHDQAYVALAVSGLKYPATLNHCPYRTDELVVFYDPEVRGPIKAVEEYAEARHGVVNFGGKTRSVVEVALGDLGLKRKVGFVAPTASMLGGLIKGSDVITTMPKRLIEFTYAGLDYCPAPIPLPPIKFELVWHRRYEHSGRNSWLRKMILDVGATLEMEAQELLLAQQS